ncbi:MAG: hypothetical protein LBJ20_00450 [Candidatus Methanoplasma sp.]|jgi:hypothetical protein|nr:hypothetical protein [Candidatus Methanoplasma sp.]
MDTESITDFISAHVPEIVLLIGGMIALLIVCSYIRNASSMAYKGLMVLGAVFGSLMVVLTVSSHTEWGTFALAVIAITGFTLVIRPFREVHFAAIGALMVMVLAYIFLGGLAETELGILADGWPRIVVAFIVGAVVYMVMNFAESIIKLFGKLLNWWPFLLILALICIAESLLMFSGYGSLYDFITSGQIQEIM